MSYTQQNFFMPDFCRLQNDIEAIKNKIKFQADIEAARKINPALIDTISIGRAVVDKIAAGYSKSESITIAAAKFGCDYKRAAAALDRHKYQTAGMLIFAKKFLIHTLQKKGLKIPDIAFLLDVSRQTVYNLLKSDFSA